MHCACAEKMNIPQGTYPCICEDPEPMPVSKDELRTAVEYPCYTCGLPIVVVAPLEAAPDEVHHALCVPCLVGLAALDRDPELQQIRVATVDVPGNAPLYVMITDRDQALDAQGEDVAMGRIAHGDVLSTEQVVASAVPENPAEVALEGRITGRLRDGVVGFSLSRELLEDPIVSAILQGVLEDAQARREAERPSIEVGCGVVPDTSIPAEGETTLTNGGSSADSAPDPRLDTLSPDA